MSDGPDTPKEIPKFGWMRPITKGAAKRELERRKTRSDGELTSAWASKGETDEEERVKEHIPKLAAFQQALDFKGGVVYYPCSADDTSPSKAFPKSRVVYADTDVRQMKELQEAGYEAYGQDVESFNPGPVDVLVLIKQPNEGAISTESFVRHLKEGGYVIAQSLVETAEKLHRDKDFEFVALIHPDENGKFIFDTSELEDCWKEIDNDEELRAYNRPDMRGLDGQIYWEVVKLVRFMTGKRENYVQEYRNLLEKLRKGEIEGVTDFDGGKDGSGIMSFEYKDQFFFFPKKLPYKKGIHKDFYVFRKKQYEQA